MPEEVERNYLQEAYLISKGQTIMLAQREHLLALTEEMNKLVREVMRLNLQRAAREKRHDN